MAYQFNGTTQYLSVNSVPITARPATLAAWGRMTANSHSAWLTISRITANNSRMQLQRFYAAGPPILNRMDLVDIGSVQTSADDGAVTNSTWTHGAGWSESATSRAVYRDGANKVTDSNNYGTASAWERIYIGARNSGGTFGLYMTGQLAEAAIWSVALSDAEVASLGKGFKPSRIRPQSLVFYAPMLRDLQDVRGGRAITNNNTATVANHPRVY